MKDNSNRDHNNIRSSPSTERVGTHCSNNCTMRYNSSSNGNRSCGNRNRGSISSTMHNRRSTRQNADSSRRGMLKVNINMTQSIGRTRSAQSTTCCSRIPVVNKNAYPCTSCSASLNRAVNSKVFFFISNQGKRSLSMNGCSRGSCRSRTGSWVVFNNSSSSSKTRASRSLTSSTRDHFNSSSSRNLHHSQRKSRISLVSYGTASRSTTPSYRPSINSNTRSRTSCSSSKMLPSSRVQPSCRVLSSSKGLHGSRVLKSKASGSKAWHERRRNIRCPFKNVCIGVSNSKNRNSRICLGSRRRSRSSKSINMWPREEYQLHMYDEQQQQLLPPSYNERKAIRMSFRSSPGNVERKSSRELDSSKERKTDLPHNCNSVIRGNDQPGSSRGNSSAASSCNSSSSTIRSSCTRSVVTNVYRLYHSQCSSRRGHTGTSNSPSSSCTGLHNSKDSGSDETLASSSSTAHQPPSPKKRRRTSDMVSSSLQSGSFYNKHVDCFFNWTSWLSGCLGSSRSTSTYTGNSLSSSSGICKCIDSNNSFKDNSRECRSGSSSCYWLTVNTGRASGVPASHRTTKSLQAFTDTTFNNRTAAGTQRRTDTHSTFSHRCSSWVASFHRHDRCNCSSKYCSNYISTTKVGCGCLGRRCISSSRRTSNSDRKECSTTSLTSSSHIKRNSRSSNIRCRRKSHIVGENSNSNCLSLRCTWSLACVLSKERMLGGSVVSAPYRRRRHSSSISNWGSNNAGEPNLRDGNSSNSVGALRRSIGQRVGVSASQCSSSDTPASSNVHPGSSSDTLGSSRNNGNGGDGSDCSTSSSNGYSPSNRNLWLKPTVRPRLFTAGCNFASESPSPSCLNRCRSPSSRSSRDRHGGDSHSTSNGATRSSSNVAMCSRTLTSARTGHDSKISLFHYRRLTATKSSITLRSRDLRSRVAVGDRESRQKSSSSYVVSRLYCSSSVIGRTRRRPIYCISSNAPTSDSTLCNASSSHHMTNESSCSRSSSRRREGHWEVRPQTPRRGDSACKSAKPLRWCKSHTWDSCNSCCQGDCENSSSSKRSINRRRHTGSSTGSSRASTPDSSSEGRGSCTQNGSAYWGDRAKAIPKESASCHRDSNAGSSRASSVSMNWNSSGRMENRRGSNSGSRSHSPNISSNCSMCESAPAVDTYAAAVETCGPSSNFCGTLLRQDMGHSGVHTCLCYVLLLFCMFTVGSDGLQIYLPVTSSAEAGILEQQTAPYLHAGGPPAASYSSLANHRHPVAVRSSPPNFLATTGSVVGLAGPTAGAAGSAADPRASFTPASPATPLPTSAASFVSHHSSSASSKSTTALASGCPTVAAAHASAAVDHAAFAVPLSLLAAASPPVTGDDAIHAALPPTSSAAVAAAACKAFPSTSSPADAFEQIADDHLLPSLFAFHSSLSPLFPSSYLHSSTSKSGSAASSTSSIAGSLTPASSLPNAAGGASCFSASGTGPCVASSPAAVAACSEGEKPFSSSEAVLSPPAARSGAAAFPSSFLPAKSPSKVLVASSSSFFAALPETAAGGDAYSLDNGAAKPSMKVKQSLGSYQQDTPSLQASFTEVSGGRIGPSAAEAHYYWQHGILPPRTWPPLVDIRVFPTISMYEDAVVVPVSLSALQPLQHKGLRQLPQQQAVPGRLTQRSPSLEPVPWMLEIESLVETALPFASIERQQQVEQAFETIAMVALDKMTTQLQQIMEQLTAPALGVSTRQAATQPETIPRRIEDVSPVQQEQQLKQQREQHLEQELQQQLQQHQRQQQEKLLKQQRAQQLEQQQEKLQEEQLTQEQQRQRAQKQEQEEAQRREQQQAQQKREQQGQPLTQQQEQATWMKKGQIGQEQQQQAPEDQLEAEALQGKQPTEKEPMNVEDVLEQQEPEEKSTALIDQNFQQQSPGHIGQKSLSFMEDAFAAAPPPFDAASSTFTLSGAAESAHVGAPAAADDAWRARTAKKAELLIIALEVIAKTIQDTQKAFRFNEEDLLDNLAQFLVAIGPEFPLERTAALRFWLQQANSSTGEPGEPTIEYNGRMEKTRWDLANKILRIAGLITTDTVDPNIVDCEHMSIVKEVAAENSPDLEFTPEYKEKFCSLNVTAWIVYAVHKGLALMKELSKGRDLEEAQKLAVPLLTIATDLQAHADLRSLPFTFAKGAKWIYT